MKSVFLTLLSIVIITGVFSLGKREKTNDSQNPPITTGAETVGFTSHGNTNQADADENNTAKIIGRIQVYGSEPHTFVGIIDQDKTEYAVYPASREEELRRLQGHLIEFTVVFLDEPQGYGSLFLKGGTVTPVKWELIQ